MQWINDFSYKGNTRISLGDNYNNSLRRDNVVSERAAFIKVNYISWSRYLNIIGYVV